MLYVDRKGLVFWQADFASLNVEEEIIPEIDRNFKQAYATWKNSGQKLKKEDDEVARRYRDRVERWFKDYKPTLQANIKTHNPNPHLF